MRGVKVDYHPDITLFESYRKFLRFYFQDEIRFMECASEVTEFGTTSAIDFEMGGERMALIVERHTCATSLYFYEAGMSFNVESPKHLVRLLTQK